MPKVTHELKETNENIEDYKKLFAYPGFFEDYSGKYREFISLSDEVDDLSINEMREYDIKTIVVIVFLAIFDYCEAWDEIEDLVYVRKEFLKDYINLDAGMPTTNTYMRVFSLLDTSTIQDIVIDFINQNLPKPMVAIEDKERYNQNLHIINVNDLCLASYFITYKENEDPTKQSILDVVNMKNCIVIADTVNTQYDTIKVIRNKKGHYVLALKKSEINFYEEVEEYFKKQESRIKKTKNYHKMETSEFFLILANKYYSVDECADIKTIVMHKKTIDNRITGEMQEERSYYISDLKDIKRIADTLKAHGEVRNNFDSPVDEKYRKTTNYAIYNKALYNFKVLSKAVYGILKLMAPLFRDHSIKLTLYSFRSNYDENVQHLFEFLNDKDIIELIKKK